MARVRPPRVPWIALGLQIRVPRSTNPEPQAMNNINNGAIQSFSFCCNYIHVLWFGKPRTIIFANTTQSTVYYVYLRCGRDPPPPDLEVSISPRGRPATCTVRVGTMRKECKLTKVCIRPLPIPVLSVMKSELCDFITDITGIGNGRIRT